MSEADTIREALDDLARRAKDENRAGTTWALIDGARDEAAALERRAEHFDWLERQNGLRERAEQAEAALREHDKHLDVHCDFDFDECPEAMKYLAATTPGDRRFCVCGFSYEGEKPEHGHEHVIATHMRGWTEHLETCATTPGENDNA